MDPSDPPGDAADTPRSRPALAATGDVYTNSDSTKASSGSSGSEGSGAGSGGEGGGGPRTPDDAKVGEQPDGAARNGLRNSTVAIPHLDPRASTPGAGGSTRTVIPAEAVQSIATLQQLSLEAGLSESRQQLIFRILNRTHRLRPYDRAVLWSTDRAGRPRRLLGVSAEAEVEETAPQARIWRGMLRRLDGLATARLAPGDALDALAEGDPSWRAYQKRVEGVAGLWLPILVRERPVAGLWLERWKGRTWTAGDLKPLTALALAYGVAWRAVHGGRGIGSGFGGVGRAARAAFLLLLLGALGAALAWVRVPMRVVAPCEIVADQPEAVTAPVDGIIAALDVEPGETVRADEPLGRYDTRQPEEEREVVARELREMEARLRLARVAALDDPRARAEARLLEKRLAREQARLAAVEARLARMRLPAPRAGVVLLEDPEAWRGRVVRTGERILTVVDPKATRVRIWLPADDALPREPVRVAVVLHQDPNRDHPVRLLYVSPRVEITDAGLPAFRAEAAWRGSEPEAAIGQRGSAVLEGEPVRLASWLFRKPYLWLRLWLGW